ncbi:hypothetical protein GW17_00050733 [Ensete ventricosum]|nr:hypothetical protein GW17_00050733 [Ensete ventricosum]
MRVIWESKVGRGPHGSWVLEKAAPGIGGGDVTRSSSRSCKLELFLRPQRLTLSGWRGVHSSSGGRRAPRST